VLLLPRLPIVALPCFSGVCCDVLPVHTMLHNPLFCCFLSQGDPYQKQRIKLGGLVETRDTIRRSRRIMFVACGTSYHAALAARQTVGVPHVVCLACKCLQADRRCMPVQDRQCVAARLFLRCGCNNLDLSLNRISPVLTCW
jgi:hypothetical protein